MIDFGEYEEKKILNLNEGTWLLLKRKRDNQPRWILLIKAKALGRELYVHAIRFEGSDQFEFKEQWVQVSEFNFNDYHFFILEEAEIQEYSKLIFAGTL